MDTLLDVELEVFYDAKIPPDTLVVKLDGHRCRITASLYVGDSDVVAVLRPELALGVLCGSSMWQLDYHKER